MNGATEFLVPWLTAPLLAAAEPLLAAAETGPVRKLEFELPTSPWQWAVYLGVLAVTILLVIIVYVRDTRELGWGWRIWLSALRLGVVAALAVILFHPQERTQKTAYRPSRVAIALDVSLSQGFPETIPEDTTPTDATLRTRAEAIKQLFAQTQLVKDLQKVHEVTIYTFDSTLSARQHVFPSDKATPVSSEEDNADGKSKAGGTTNPSSPAPNPESLAPTAITVDWNELLRPRGLESRIGDAVRKLIDEEAGKTLSALVIVSDGALNAGVDHLTANAAARQAKVRLVTIGVGSTQKQPNLKLAGLQAPTDVHVGDPYELTVLVQGQGFAGRNAEIELSATPADDESATPTVLDKREVALLEDGVPVEVKFKQTPSVPAKLKYTVKVRPDAKTREADESDNQDSTTISIVDKKTRVLLIAGGPMRDYQFVRNMLYRHNAVKADVWLQSVLPETAGKVSQESENLLTSFPDNEADLFQYDVIIGFDVNWRMIPSDSLKILSRWVAEESGGLILIAGDVFTPELASAGDSLAAVADLYPVFLSGTEFQLDQTSEQAWPFSFSQEGQNAGFLQLTDDPQTSATKWKEFEGVFQCYPSSGAKPAATVYARFPDPRMGAGGQQPVLMASQYFGSGRVIYFGTNELWRLRQLSDEYYDRIWTKTVREVGQERLTRGTQRALLMPERDKYYIGQMVTVRARILDPQFRPLAAENVPIDVVGPDRRPLSPARQLDRDKNRVGQFNGTFRVTQAGRYRIELRVPDSSEVETKDIDVRVPDLESEQREQNASLLTELARDTGGKYLKLEEAETQLAALLPNQGEMFVVDERLKSLWDKDWVLYALVGLLGLEWLTRKLLRLA